MVPVFISFSSLSYDRYKAFSKASSAHSSFLCNPSCKCGTCCRIFPLETLPPGNPNGGVVYLRIVLSPKEASRMCISVFVKRLSSKSNNVSVFPFTFHMAEQQSFKPLWSRLLLYDLEPSQASFALRFKSCIIHI
jgi:hypothetical protein